ncbi:MAG: RNA ligase, partial [Desulfurobacteriaceae bacterium]
MELRLSEVLKEIEGNKFFKLLKEENLIKISYRFNSPKVFDSPIKRELRGITFDAVSGRVLSRPFHKFFNLNEHPETEERELSGRRFVFREKFDGTMLHPVLVGGEVRFLSQKAFRNPQVEKGEELLRRSGKLYESVKKLLEKGYTPIFELISPQFQLVIPYEEELLLLTEVRRNRDGRYVMEESSEELEEMGFVLPPVFSGTLEEAKAVVSDREGIEGFVGKEAVWREPFPLFFKLKSPWYYDRHYAFTYLHNIPDHKLFNLFLRGEADDIFQRVTNRELREYKRKRLSLLTELYGELLSLVDSLAPLYGKMGFEEALRRGILKLKGRFSGKFRSLDINENYLKEACRIRRR